MLRIIDNTEHFKILCLSNYHFPLNLENLTSGDLGRGVQKFKIRLYFDEGLAWGRVLASQARSFGP